MNELSILMHLLSRKVNKYQIGATKDQIIETLHIDGKHEEVYFHHLITNLSKQIEPLGLNVQYNPLDAHWFIAYDSNLSNLVSANPFEDKPKLAATLFYVITCCLSNSGSTKIKRIKDLRNKKGIMNDLKELEEFGYIKLYPDVNEVAITEKIGYQINLPQLFTKLSLKLKKDSEKENNN